MFVQFQEAFNFGFKLLKSIYKRRIMLCGKRNKCDEGEKKKNLSKEVKRKNYRRRIKLKKRD